MTKTPGYWGVIVSPFLIIGLGLLWMTEGNVGGILGSLAIVPLCLMALGLGTYSLSSKSTGALAQRIKLKR